MDIKKVMKGELIGLNAKIVDSNNKSNIGIKGKIIDETKNTFKIENKTILKKEVVIEFEINDQKITIEGKNLIKNPEDRIKKK